MEQKKQTFKVVYGLEVIVDSLAIEQALQFALNLHQSSNVAHIITVEDDETTILTLKKDAS